MTLRPGMIERFRAALPVLQELQNDLDWIENEFSPRQANEEERSQVKHLKTMAYRQFDEAAWRLERMFLPVDAKGYLVLNEQGRYQIENTSIYFTCGSSCEIFLPFYDDDEEYFTWIPTSIESKNGEYYFTARPDVSMTGVLVRTKKR